MKIRYYIFPIFLFLILQRPMHAEKSQPEEKIFYEQVMSYYEKKDTEKFYSFLIKFNKLYPKSPYLNQLNEIAATQLFQEGKYFDALYFYNQIQSLNSQTTLFNDFLQCHLQLGNYELILNLLDGQKIQGPQRIEILLSALKNLLQDPALDFSTRIAYTDQSIYIYETLPENNFANDSLFYLANLYFQKKEYEASADILNRLVKNKPDNLEEVYYQLANVQTFFDIDQSIETLDLVIALNGEYTNRASYKKMATLIQTKQYQRFVQCKDQIYIHLDKNMHGLYHFYLGLCFFQNNEITEAQKQFKIFLASGSDHTPYERNARNLLSKISELKNSSDTNIAFNEQSAILPELNEEQTKSYSLKQALDYKNDKNFQEAEEALVYLHENYPQVKHIEFELGHVYFETEQWQKAHDCFKSFLNKGPETTLDPLAWNYFIESSLLISNDPNNKFGKAHLAYDLSKCLLKNDCLSKEERQTLTFLLAKTQFEIAAYEESIDTIELLIQQDLSENVLSKAFLLLGYCYKSAHDDLVQFFSCLKKATELEPSLKKSKKIQAALHMAKHRLKKRESFAARED